MATYGFSKEGAKRVRDVVDWAERRGARTYRRHKRRRMAGEEGGSGTTETCILGQVVGNVTTGTATFDVDNIDLVFGTDPRDDPDSAAETVTFNNTFSQAYSDNDIIIGWQRIDDEHFETDRFDGAAGIKLYRFELTEDLSTEGTSATAFVVDDDGATTEEVINVVDTEQYFYGRTAYTGADGEEYEGYKGVALKFTNDYDESGYPGAHIIAMEGPAVVIVVELDEDVDDLGPTQSTLWKKEGYDVWAVLGSNLSHRIPVQEEGGVLVYNDFDFASGANAGEIWLAMFQQPQDEYILIHRLDIPLTGNLMAIIKGSGTGGALDTSFDTTADVRTKTLAKTYMQTPSPLPSEIAGGSHDFSSGALLVKCTTFGNDGSDFGNITALTDINGDQQVLWALGTSVTSFIGEDEGVLVSGHILLDEDGKEVRALPDGAEEGDEVRVFVIDSIFDMRSLPNFDVDLTQITYHEGTDSSFKLDGTTCE